MGWLCCFGLSEVGQAERTNELYTKEAIRDAVMDEESSGLDDADEDDSPDVFSTPLEQLNSMDIERQVDRLFASCQPHNEIVRSSEIGHDDPIIDSKH